MAKITLAGNPIETVGSLPERHSAVPSYVLVGADLEEITSDDFAGKQVIINIFPSIDTGVCANSVRRFNVIASELPNTVVLSVSNDLPFALGRFCGAEGIDKVVTASAFRSSFGDDYGVKIATGPMKGLLSRAVVVVGADGKVTYTQQVPEIKQEPDYQEVLDGLERG